MHRLAQGGAALAQHAQGPLPDDLAWDDIRVFLGCLEARSFRKAGDRLGLNASTVARRIDGIERRLGYQLFARVKDGLVITPEGKALTTAARTMERSFYELVRKMQEPRFSHRGLVRLSITDGLGTFWVMPLLVEFGRQNPNLIVEINCAVDSADVLRLEADLAIQFVRPDDLDLKVVRLGRLHVYPFASMAYVERYGLPASVEDMVNHRLVDQVGPQMTQGAWAHYLRLDSVEGIVGIRSNASSAVFYAVEKGAGIGALPTFASALDAPVVPVDLGIHHHMDIWLTYHPDVRDTKRVSHVIEWIRSIFDPIRYPWFRDEFIHPRALVDMAPPGTALQSVKGSFAATPFRT
ncbi:MAG: LysR family transcriptional regulator [Bauldia sp.]